MDWDRIRIFLEVARTGQILGAAKRLKLNHSTVARQLTALEEDLQTKLVNRATTGSSLTPAGVALQPELLARFTPRYARHATRPRGASIHCVNDPSGS
jgi:molybdate transport repressor ModE-like protein